MKKLLMMIVMAIGFVLNANADGNVIVTDIQYNGNQVSVILQMTNAAKQKYESVRVKVVPSRGIQGIVEGVKYTTLSKNIALTNHDTGSGCVYFQCEDGKANQCKKYDFEVITQDVIEKK